MQLPPRKFSKLEACTFQRRSLRRGASADGGVVSFENPKGQMICSYCLWTVREDGLEERLTSHLGINLRYYNEKRSDQAKQNQQYSYVMKKNATGCGAKAPPQKKTKQKGKHQSKEKRFNVDQYLDSLMVGMHEQSTETVRKRKLSAAKRQLSSALAHTTPHSQRTASSSKIRCKSSYSQYRKKSVTIREGLHLNLDKIVTEQDVINFTEVTVRGKEDNQPPQPVKLKPMSQALAARKIQRAWRNYQTRKVVSKYFEQMCFKITQDKEVKQKVVENSTFEEETVKKQAKRTLKIRKQDRKTSPITVTKVPKVLFKSLDSEDQQIRVNSSQGNETLTIEFKQTQQLMDRQMPSSKELQSIVEMLINNHETASKEIEEHFNNFCAGKSNLPVYSEQSEELEGDRGSSIFSQKKSSFAQLEGISPLVFIQMENSIKQKFNLLQTRLQEKVKLRLINNQQRLKACEQLEGRMLREIRVLNHCKQQYMKSIQQLREQMIKMQNDNAIVAKLEGRIGYRVRRSYSAQSLLMKEILQEVTNKNVDLEKPFTEDQAQVVLQYNFRKKKKEEGSGLSFPTSPPSVIGGSNQKLANSGQSLVCYELDSDQKLRQELLNSQIRNIQVISAENNLQFNEFQNDDSQLSQGLQRGVLKCDSIQSINVSLPQNSFRQQDNSRLIRECSEQIQEKIEATLIQQIAQQIYGSEYFWKQFRPYIQKPFQFKKIEDYDIRYFLEEDLPNYFPPYEQLICRINQKINPTTLQILRLIRDIQFEIEEYDLVMPEEVFKKYRKHVEETYLPKIVAEQQKKYLPIVTLPYNINILAQKRFLQHKQKMVRFIKFQRDVRIMYMKSIFNSLNEVIIENKSNYTFMNARSSIGPGELTLAIKQYNWNCQHDQLYGFLGQARNKILRTISNKCGLPQFKTHRDLQIFQNQFNKQLKNQLEQYEYKWVNYMDQVMQIWQDLCLSLVQTLFDEAVSQISLLF